MRSSSAGPHLGHGATPSVGLVAAVVCVRRPACFYEHSWGTIGQGKEAPGPSAHLGRPEIPRIHKHRDRQGNIGLGGSPASELFARLPPEALRRTPALTAGCRSSSGSQRCQCGFENSVSSHFSISFKRPRLRFSCAGGDVAQARVCTQGVNAHPGPLKLNHT